MSDQPVDYQQALLDPGAVFSSPEEVVDHPDLNHEQKRELLRRWKYDAVELAVATEEGMGGGEDSLQDRVSRALESLGGDAPDVPTKHGV